MTSKRTSISWTVLRAVQPKDQPLADPLHGLVRRVTEYSGYTWIIATSEAPLHTELAEEAGEKTMGGLLMNLCKSILLIACLQASVQALANEELFERAGLAASQGEITLMQETYALILQSDPTNVRALNGAATALAWSGNYSVSQSTYRQALEIEPDNLDALTGIGYAYAWSGDYDKAHSSFLRGLEISPGNVNARKGNAYAYLWSGDTDQALQLFEQLAEHDQTDAEVAVALGHAHLELGEARHFILNSRYPYEC